MGESRLAGSSAPLLGPKINELIKSIDPSLSIEPAAEEQVLCLVDDFVDKVVKQSMRLAQHRSSRTLDVSDIQLILSQQWGITVPGLGPPPTKKKLTTTSTPASSSGGTKRKLSGAAAASAAAKASKSAAGQTAAAAASDSQK